MLVLTRKAHQSIIIGQSIKLEIISVSRNRVCLGITAPQSIPVNREEIAVKIGQQNLKEQFMLG
jgi:carbon storage regulator